MVTFKPVMKFAGNFVISKVLAHFVLIVSLWYLHLKSCYFEIINFFIWMPSIWWRTEGNLILGTYLNLALIVFMLFIYSFHVPKELLVFLVVGCRYWPTYAPMDVRLPHELNVYQVQYTLRDRCFSCWHRQCALCNCLTL